MVLTYEAEWGVRKEGTAERVPELGSRTVYFRTPNPMSGVGGCRLGKVEQQQKANHVIYCLNWIISESEMEVLQTITQNNRWQLEL